MRGLMIAAALVAMAAPAKAVDGNEIYVSCVEKYDQQPFGMFCKGYLIALHEGVQYGAGRALVRSGATDTNASYEEIKRDIYTGLGFCTPDGISKTQIFDIYRKYLIENPHQRHLAAVSIYIRAMTKHFPCD